VSIMTSFARIHTYLRQWEVRQDAFGLRTLKQGGPRVSTVVKVLCYKSEGR